MAVFVSHSDESGVQDPRGGFLVGGYAAPELDWPCFVRAWQERVLDGPPMIPYLHMNEIRRESWRSKYGISTLDAENRIDEAIRIITSTGGLLATASTLNRGDLEDTIHRKLREQRKMRPPIGLDEPDYLCFLAYSEFTIAQAYRRDPDVEKVNFVVSFKQKVSHHIREFHAELKSLIGPPFESLVGELLPASMEAILPLQAADVFCWHLQRHVAQTLDRSDQRRLNVLIETTGYPHEYSKEDLNQLADGLIARMVARAENTEKETASTQWSEQ